MEALQAVAGDSRVTLSWSYPPDGLGNGFRIDVAGGPFDAVSPLGKEARSADVTGLTNGIQYSFSVVAERGSDVSAAVTISATPGVTSFVIDPPPIFASVRNNYSGLVGMEIMVGSSPIVVTQLGRIVATTNSGVHEVKIVRPVTTPVTGVPVAGIDVVSANVTTVAQVSQANVGTFAWTPLPQPVTLQANTIYFIVSSEIDGGDLWYGAVRSDHCGRRVAILDLHPHDGTRCRQVPAQFAGPGLCAGEFPLLSSARRGILRLQSKRRMVDQNSVSWNHVTTSLRQVESLQPAA